MQKKTQTLHSSLPTSLKESRGIKNYAGAEILYHQTSTMRGAHLGSWTERRGHKERKISKGISGGTTRFLPEKARNPPERPREEVKGRR